MDVKKLLEAEERRKEIGRTKVFQKKRTAKANLREN